MTSTPLRLVLPKEFSEPKLDPIHVRIALDFQALGATVAIPCLARFTFAALANHLLLLLALLLIQDKHASGALLETMTFSHTRIPQACRGNGSKRRFCVA